MKKNSTHTLKHFLTVKNKKFSYELTPISKKTTGIVCESANINQEFLNEDVPGLLGDLPHLILAEKEYSNAQSEVIRFRVSPEDKKRIEQKALKKGYSSVSGFLRNLSLGSAKNA